jgi:hypothetical protein
VQRTVTEAHRAIAPMPYSIRAAAHDGSDHAQQEHGIYQSTIKVIDSRDSTHPHILSNVKEWGKMTHVFRVLIDHYPLSFNPRVSLKTGIFLPDPE